MFGVQLYKNNARALLSRILSILNLDWLQHACSVRGVYELALYSLLKRLLNWGFHVTFAVTCGDKVNLAFSCAIHASIIVMGNNTEKASK